MFFVVVAFGVAFHPPCLIVGGDTNPAREGCVCVCVGGGVRVPDLDKWERCIQKGIWHKICDKANVQLRPL